jgi:hypothetical protein
VSPGQGPGGYNTNLCPGPGAAATPAVGSPNCGAVASLAPAGPNLTNPSLPGANSIPGAKRFAIVADWQDNNAVPCNVSQCSMLRCLLNNMLYEIQSPRYLTSALVGWDKDAIVTDGSQT